MSSTWAKKAMRQVQALNYRRPKQRTSLRFLEASKEPSIPPPLQEPNYNKSIDLIQALHLKVGDIVQILYGPDKGREGTILKIDGNTNTLIVEGCNLRKMEWNSTIQKGRALMNAKEMPIHVTNVSILDPITKRPTRIKYHHRLDGMRVRISKISGCAIPEPLQPIATDKNYSDQAETSALQKPSNHDKSLTALERLSVTLKNQNHLT